jgi:hypothetical protein
MYNLTVVIAHTFFVGEEQWLVHNDLCLPDHIVLGFQRHVETKASTIGGTSLMGFGNWKEMVSAAIYGGKKPKISVILDDFHGDDVVQKFQRAAQAGALPNANPTNWEMSMLYDNKEVLSKVDFWLNGKKYRIDVDTWKAIQIE